jgi:hypothetical protein
MSVALSEKQITYLEEFIDKNEERKSSDILSNVSMSDIINGLDTYKKMKSGEVEDKYFIFGENGMGYTVYSLYKSKCDKIYLIYVNMQTPTYYASIDSESEFENFY